MSSTFLAARRIACCAALALPMILSPLPAEDGDSADSVVKALYRSLTFAAGERPDLDAYRSICHPEARFVRITPDGPVMMDLEGFIASFAGRIDRGEIRTFHESEISRRTEAYGSLAQVFSVYQKGMNTVNPAEFVRGVNCIQLFNDGRRWRIVSVVWQDERPGLPIPESYLIKGQGPRG